MEEDMDVVVVVVVGGRMPAFTGGGVDMTDEEEDDVRLLLLLLVPTGIRFTLPIVVVVVIDFAPPLTPLVVPVVGVPERTW
jgi:hypothetical protein